MPPKVRDLVRQLEQAGFRDRGGKGSHRNYVHPRVSQPLTISGKPGKLYTGFATALRLQSSAARHRAAGNIGNIDKVRNDAAED